MYDFIFGSAKKIKENPKNFLLSVKRMLPRWCNSIPDSEFLAIYDVLSQANLPESPVIVETGSGASTLVLYYFALIKNGTLFTWDTNGSKLSYLRGVIGDSITKALTDKNIFENWKYVAYSSTSKNAGIPIIGEKGLKVNACFLDSEHTLNNLMKEVEQVSKLFSDEAIIMIDDGYYSYVYENTAYENMIRSKLELPPVECPSDNTGRSFWESVESRLKSNFNAVIHIEDSYKENFTSDLFFSYYQNDLSVMKSLEMSYSPSEKERFAHRFDAWRITK